MKRIVLALLVAGLVLPIGACRGRRIFSTSQPTTAYRPAPATMPAPMPAPCAPPPVMAPPPAEIIVEPPAAAMMPILPPAEEVVIGEPPMAGEDMPPAEEAMPVPIEIEEPPMVAQPVAPPPAEPMAPAEPVETTPTADEYLQEMTRLAEIERQKREVLAQDYLDKARDALSQGDIEGGRHWYGEVLQLDPANEIARRALRDISSDRTSTVGEFLDRQRSVESVRRQQAAAEVKNYVERARTFEGREDYDSAVKEYQKALAIVSWYTDTRDFGITADQIRDLIENAKYKAEISERTARQEQIRAAQMEREQDLAGERERRLSTIRAYFEEAHLAFRRGEYAVAREYANQILQMDPQNNDARMLVCITHDAQHLRNQEEARRMFDDQWKAVFAQLERDTLPQVQTVVFPEDWLEGIAKRTPRIVGESGPEEDASIAAILTTLDGKRVKGLNWEGENLDQVITYLRTITGLNFFITPRVRAEKYDEVEVTLSLDDVTVRTVLDLITEPYELKWSAGEGVVRIATSDEIRGDMVIRYFDIKDLTVLIENHVGQEINLVPSNFMPPEPPELPDPAPIFPEEGLVDLIRETIGGETAWEDPATIEVRNRIIIARNTTEILGKVQALLDDLRANSGLLVNLEVRFLTAEDNFLRDVGVDLRGLGDDSQGIGAPGLGTDAPMDDLFFGSAANPYGVPFGVFPEPPSTGTSNDSGIFYNDGQDGAYQARVENLFDILLGNPEVLTGSGGLSFQHVYLDDTEIEVILRAVEKSERIQQITASRITVYNTQRANVSVLNQVSYVQDYEVEVAQASNIANPVIQTIQDGVVLDVRPVVTQDLRFVMLELRPTVALLTRPIATFSTSLASGPFGAAPVVIQIPELSVSRVRTTVVMPDGGTLLLGGLKFYEQINQDVGIPLASDIPILGFLFSRKGNYVNRRNLIILITAHIVPLEELEPKSELDLPPLPERNYVPIRPFEPCEPMPVAAPTCAPSPCQPPPCEPPPCGPCGEPRQAPKPPACPPAGPMPPFSYGR